MFVNIFSWMLSNVPGFMRPGVNWLISGVRKITGVVAALWNVLGMAVGGLFNAVNGFRIHLLTFAGKTVMAVWWIKNVWIPNQIWALYSTVTQVISAVIASVRAEVSSWIDALSQWAQWALGQLRELVQGLARWALDQVTKIVATYHALVGALAHVLNGPGALAEWLLGALWQSALRRLYAERDRLLVWLFQGSPSFTAWLARVLEDMIVRLL